MDAVDTVLTFDVEGSPSGLVLLTLELETVSSAYAYAYALGSIDAQKMYGLEVRSPRVDQAIKAYAERQADSSVLVLQGLSPAHPLEFIPPQDGLDRLDFQEPRPVDDAQRSLMQAALTYLHQIAAPQSF